MQTIHVTYPTKHAHDLSSGPRVLAIGDFDGVHLGHQEVIGRAVRRGAERHIPAAIMTFHPHPREVLGLEQYVRLLTPLAAKLDLFAKLGVNTAYTVEFNQPFMKLTPEQFVEHVLLPLQVDTVFVGFDFRFGHQGAGTPDSLCELAKGRFAVEVVRPFLREGEKVSSTLIRSHLAEGRVAEAAALLGRPYRVKGPVVHGDARGRTIGFPTANLELAEPYLYPASGVYAIHAHVQGRRLNGVMNVGVKPTFVEGLQRPVLEAHLFEFGEDIYGEVLEIELLSYIRPERKFASVAELIDQIGKDSEQARRIASQLAK